MEQVRWDEHYAVSDMLCSGEPNVWVEELAESLPAGRLLDLAGGEGRNALWLASRGWDATIVDCSQSALDRATQCAEQLPRARGRVHVLRADVRKHVPPRQAYDLVLIAYLHLPRAERSAAVNLAVGAVAPGGHLMVVGHDIRNLTEGVGGPQDPELLFAPQDIVDHLAGRGLIIQEAQTRERPVQTDRGRRAALDAVVIASRP